MNSNPPQSPSRTFPVVVIATGLIIVLGSIFADDLGLSWGGEGFGWKQLIATIVGLVIIAAGAGLWQRQSATTN